MAKLIVLFATFALFILLANASTYRTTVEVDEDDVNQRGQGQCQREFQQQQQLRGCQQWIRRRIQRGADEFELVVDEVEEENQRMPPSLRQCCNELHQVDRMCVCPVLRHAAQQVRYQGQHQGPQVRHMFQVARNLPNICNIPVGQCQFSASPY